MSKFKSEENNYRIQRTKERPRTQNEDTFYVDTTFRRPLWDRAPQPTPFRQDPLVNTNATTFLYNGQAYLLHAVMARALSSPTLEPKDLEGAGGEVVKFSRNVQQEQFKCSVFVKRENKLIQIIQGTVPNAPAKLVSSTALKACKA